MGSKEDVAARIEADTKIKIDEMQKAVSTHKEAVCTMRF
jgi:V-type H+-transporting ATPase subunit G